MQLPQASVQEEAKIAGLALSLMVRRRLLARITLSMAKLKEDKGLERWTSPRFTRHMAPTVYFPLVVPECMMIEPTETESKATLDEFANLPVGNS